MPDAPAFEVDRATLTSVVARALGQSVELVGEWTTTEIKYDAFNPVSAGLYRLTGEAQMRSGTAGWSVIAKRCHEPSKESLARLPPVRRESEIEFLRWDREARAYDSDLLSALPPGLVAPRCFGVEWANTSARIWLEDVRDEMLTWDVERYALAARHLGRLNGQYLATRPLPSYPWLSRRWVQGWVGFFTRNVPAQLEDDQIWTAPLVLELFGPDARDQLRRILAALERWWTALDQLPPTLAHVDAFRANLMSRVVNGQTETVAVDWAFVGIAPLAADVAQLVLASIFYHRERLAPHALEEPCLYGYEEGLRDSGYQVSPLDLRRAYVINAITRWLFILGSLSAAGDTVRQHPIEAARGKPYREILAPVAEKTRYLLALSHEVTVD